MPVLARHRDHLAVDVGRRGPRRARPKARSVPAPRDLEALEIGRIDLRRRRVAGVPGVTAHVGPRRSLHARALRRNGGAGGGSRDGSEEKGEKKGAARPRTPVVLHHPSALAVHSSALRASHRSRRRRSVLPRLPRITLHRGRAFPGTQRLLARRRCFFALYQRAKGSRPRRQREQCHLQEDASCVDRIVTRTMLGRAQRPWPSLSCPLPWVSRSGISRDRGRRRTG